MDKVPKFEVVVLASSRHETEFGKWGQDLLYSPLLDAIGVTGTRGDQHWIPVRQLSDEVRPRIIALIADEKTRREQRVAAQEAAARRRARLEEEEREKQEAIDRAVIAEAPAIYPKAKSPLDTLSEPYGSPARPTLLSRLLGRKS